MTTESGAQNQPVEVPAMASTGEQQPPAEATPAALRVQILATSTGACSPPGRRPGTSPLSVPRCSFRCSRGA
jgi:hypothetical protein